MDICHLYRSEKDAREAHYDFVRHACSIDKVPIFFKDDRNQCVVDGETHWFLSEYRYETWCKGRDYILDGQLMHSGYPMK